MRRGLGAGHQGGPDKYLLTDRTASSLQLSIKLLNIVDWPYQMVALHSGEQETLILVMSCARKILHTYQNTFTFHYFMRYQNSVI